MTTKRIEKEFEDLKNDPPEYCTVELDPVSKSVYHWQATITGPNDSPFAGGVFHLSIRFPDSYPYQQPRIEFLTQVYHPNISNKIICLDILRRLWRPTLNMSEVLPSIHSLLANPDPGDPLDRRILEEYLTDRAKYEETARSWTQKYAMGFVKTSCRRRDSPRPASQQYTTIKLRSKYVDPQGLCCIL